MTLFLFLPLVLEEHNILRVGAHRSRQGQDTRLSSTLLNLSALALAPLVVLFDMWHRVSTWHRLNRCVYILAANHRTLVLNSRRTIRIARSERHKRTRFQMQFWKRICKRYYLLSVKLYGVNNCFDLPVRRRISFCAIHWKSCGRAEIVMIYGTVIQLRDRSSVWVDKHLSATWHSLWEIVCQFISIQRIWCIELTKSLSVKKVNVEFSCALFSTKTFTAFVSTCPPYKNTPMFVAQNPDCKHILLSSCDIQRPIQLLWRKKTGTSESAAAAAKLGACKQSSHRGENGSQSLCSGVMPSTNKARRREKTVARQRISRDFSSGLPITFKQSDAVNPF